MSIRIDGTNTAANPGITGTDADTGLQFGTDEVSIVTGGTERVKVNAAGSIEATSAADVRLTLGSSGTAGTNDSVHIRGDGANLLFMNGSGGITRFEQNGTEELRIQSGGGISFNGDTAAANALDAYEEGSWSPVGNIDLAGAVSSRYIKIGRFVTVTSRITFPSSSSGTTVNISGLPFPVDDDLSNSAMANVVGETSYTSTDRPVACVENSDVIRFRINGSTSMTFSNFSGHNVRFSVSYFSST